MKSTNGTRNATGHSRAKMILKAIAIWIGTILLFGFTTLFGYRNAGIEATAAFLFVNSLLAATEVVYFYCAYQHWELLGAWMAKALQNRHTRSSAMAFLLWIGAAVLAWGLFLFHSESVYPDAPMWGFGVLSSFLALVGLAFFYAYRGGNYLLSLFDNHFDTMSEDDDNDQE